MDALTKCIDLSAPPVFSALSLSAHLVAEIRVFRVSIPMDVTT